MISVLSAILGRPLSRGSAFEVYSEAEVFCKPKFSGPLPHLRRVERERFRPSL